MDAGGAGGAGGGVSGQGAPSARSARQALLLAVQACGVNEAAVCEASEECLGMDEEIEWAIAVCSFEEEDDDPVVDEDTLRAVGEQARFYRARATKWATGGSGSGSRGMDVSGDVDGPDAAWAERARQALLLVTQFAGVSAVAVRKVRAMRDAKKKDLVRVLDEVAEEWDKWHPESGLDWLLERAAHYGIASALRHALFRGANVHQATYCRSADCLRLVLEAGGDADNVDVDGNTHLHRIFREYTFLHFPRSDCADCVRLLLEAGADTEKADAQGRSALMLAMQERGCQEGRRECIQHCLLSQLV
uniref:Uncharacterized protein n=1 Tax=Prasinoderma coloniale TaxID=156133 RepID=A0A7R9XZF5_9VIRI|mmetsp:Transcript_2024/g.8072  ORF Transcript_2024/g.8072 Transcript_2024/m.8072 type:complete len:305 (+) Transcript_2024:120-1034(+)